MSMRIGVCIGSLACVLAFVCAHLSFAPFTPAVVSVFATVPLSVVAILLGAMRLGIFALYWSFVTVMAFPTVMSSESANLLYVIYFCGIALGFWLAINSIGKGKSRIR